MPLSKEQELELLELLEAQEEYRSYHLIDQYFPETGEHRRELYSKHLEFFRAGAKYPERLFIAANQVGKSLAGLYEATCHATGLYPEWWEGRKWNRPTTMWIAGNKNDVVRNGLIPHLLGENNQIGTGLIPKHLIKDVKTKPGIPGSYEIIEVWYKSPDSGKYSTIYTKTYESEVQGFVSARVDFIMLDEEPPRDIYLECLVRIAAKKGCVVTTFTPDFGVTETILSFFKDGKPVFGEVTPYKYCVNVEWDDVPHLTEERKAQMKAAMLPHQIEAKTKGLPYLGAGAVYPIHEDQITVDWFEIPMNWPRFYGLDVGWNTTAAVWVALDPQSMVYYVYSEYFRGQAEPSTHAQGIKARGEWINGAIDPAAQGRSQLDGRSLLDQYYQLGLILWPADNSVESGILKIYQMLSSGKLKILKTLKATLSEYRLYRRDMNGKIKKQNDHLMDALRYAMVTGVEYALSEADFMLQEDINTRPIFNRQINPITGY